MRFKKGDRVEVFTKFGSWRSATIISGNGRKYMVTYGQPENCEGRFDLDRVSRKAMRPMPPPVDGLEDLHPGDIVEVSYSGSWIVASVVSTVDGIHFFVKLFGAAQELRVHKIKLRLRQFWQDDHWFVTGKDHRLKQFWQDDQLILTGKDHRNTKETTAVYEEIHEPATKKIQIPSLPVPATKKTKIVGSWMIEDCESVCAPSFANDTLKRKYDLNSSGIYSKSVKRHRSLPLVKLAHASSQGCSWRLLKLLAETVACWLLTSWLQLLTSLLLEWYCRSFEVLSSSKHILQKLLIDRLSKLLNFLFHNNTQCFGIVALNDENFQL